MAIKDNTLNNQNTARQVKVRSFSHYKLPEMTDDVIRQFFSDFCSELRIITDISADLAEEMSTRLFDLACQQQYKEGQLLAFLYYHFTVSKDREVKESAIAQAMHRSLSETNTVLTDEVKMLKAKIESILARKSNSETTETVKEKIMSNENTTTTSSNNQANTESRMNIDQSTNASIPKPEVTQAQQLCTKQVANSSKKFEIQIPFKAVVITAGVAIGAAAGYYGYKAYRDHMNKTTSNDNTVGETVSAAFKKFF